MFKHFFPEYILSSSILKKLKKMKITTAILQTFLFKYRKSNSITDHLNELYDICNDDNKNVPEGMYI